MTDGLAGNAALTSASAPVIGYGEQSYWNKRYNASSDNVYDWYMSYAEIKDQLVPWIKSAVLAETGPLSYNTDGTNSQKPIHTEEAVKLANDQSHNSPVNHTDTSAVRAAVAQTGVVGVTPRILVLGCGNSTLSHDMLVDGYDSIVSVDYSDVVIQAMQKRYAEELRTHPQYKYIHADVRYLHQLGSADFGSELYDVIIDKGTLDSILCGTDSSKHSGAVLQECRRLLKPSGVYICITYGAPQNRLSILNKARYNWQVADHALGNARYMYVCKCKPAG